MEVGVQTTTLYLIGSSIFAKHMMTLKCVSSITVEGVGDHQV